MKSKQFFFETSVIWGERTSGLVISPDADEQIRVATPIEFPDGEEGKWSPESLFLGAISSCFMTTFLSLAKRNNLAFVKFRCHASGVIENINGIWKFTKIDLYPELHLMEETERSSGELVLSKAEKYCLIGNSVKSEIICHPMVTAEEELVCY